MVAPVVAAAGIGAVGSLLGGMFGAKSSAKAAAKQMAFQERMRNTQHQAEVKDLRAAGLNPILSATGGGGAASPSGAMPDIPDWGSIVGENARNVTTALLMKKQLEQIDAGIAKTNAERENTDAQTRVTNYDYALRREYGPLEKQAGLWESKTRIRKLLQESESSAVDTKTKESRLKRELADPELQQWIISEGYASQNQIDRVMRGDADVSDLVGLLLKVVGKR